MIRNLALIQSKFVIVYTISALLCFFFIKSFSLISPLLIVFLLLFFVQARPNYNLSKILQYAFVVLLIGCFYSAINKDFLWTNFFFYFVTFSPLFILLISFREIVDERLTRRITRITLLILLIESVIGILQVFYNALFITHGFDGGTGDAAMGTINPTLTAGDGSASNVYFAIGLSGLAVLAFVSAQFSKSNRNILILLIILASWVLASVMHSIFLLLSAVVITLLILVFFMPKSRISFLVKQLKAIRSIMGLTMVVGVLLFVAIPGNVELVQVYYERTFVPEKMESPKAIVTLKTVRDLGVEKPYQRFIGLGPGQYSSRASLILSDKYLNSKLPEFMVSLSPDLEKYILPNWLDYKSATFQAGSTYFPFYSWLSLYGEWGLIGCAIFLFVIIRFIRRTLRAVNPVNFYLIIGILIITFYLLLLGIQDNYWEWAQFMLPILLYAKVVYYMAIKSEEDKKKSQIIETSNVSKGK
jgi:hypothetical protein